MEVFLRISRHAPIAKIAMERIIFIFIYALFALFTMKIILLMIY